MGKGSVFLRDGLPGLTSHDDGVLFDPLEGFRGEGGGEGTEVFEVGGEVPGEVVVFSNPAFGAGRDDEGDGAETLGEGGVGGYGDGVGGGHGGGRGEKWKKKGCRDNCKGVLVLWSPVWCT